MIGSRSELLRSLFDMSMMMMMMTTTTTMTMTTTIVHDSDDNSPWPPQLPPPLRLASRHLNSTPLHHAPLTIQILRCHNLFALVHSTLSSLLLLLLLTMYFLHSQFWAMEAIGGDDGGGKGRGRVKAPMFAAPSIRANLHAPSVSLLPSHRLSLPREYLPIFPLMLLPFPSSQAQTHRRLPSSLQHQAWATSPRGPVFLSYLQILPFSLDLSSPSSFQTFIVWRRCPQHTGPGRQIPASGFLAKSCMSR
jgi:hypothetical protein